LKKQKKTKQNNKNKYTLQKNLKKTQTKSTKENKKNPESLRKHDFRPGLQE